jgi:hypothetical protein
VIWKISLTALCIFAVSWCIWSNQKEVIEQKSDFFDGPDKALAHNYYMIQDRKEKRIPYERLQDARRGLQTSRLNSEERDFKWKSWDTKIPGRSRLVYYHESSGTLFAGSVTGGLWRNTDYKNNSRWELVNEFGGAAVNCIAVDPVNSDILYVGTGESFTAIVNYRESTGVGNGIYKSTDGGLTWTEITSTANFYFVNDLIVRNEEGTSVLYAAVGSGTYQGRQFVQEGLYRTSNQGASWQQVLPTIPGIGQGYCVSDLELTSTNRIYAGTMRNIQDEGGGIILYSDDGTTWSLYTGFSDFTKEMDWASAGRSVVKAAPSNPDHLYALFTMGYTNALDQLRDYDIFLKQSTDGGITWQDIQ